MIYYCGYSPDGELSTLLIGVDSLLGGDVLHESGTKHSVADCWSSRYKPNAIYYDEFAELLRRNGGFKGVNSAEIDKFIKKYNLMQLSREISEKSDFSLNRKRDSDRRTYFCNVGNALHIMLRTILAQVHGKQLPSFDERYSAVTRLPTVDLVDPAEARELLCARLADAGYETKKNRQLHETYLAWRAKQREVPRNELSQRVEETIQQFILLARKNIFPKLNLSAIGHEPDLSDVDFSGFNFKTVSGVHFTGSNIYRGGEKNGKPAFRSLFEYNTDHPLTQSELYHLCGHEAVPGHYLQHVMTDLLHRSGKLGFESTIGTMCTSEAVFQEGWAQNAFKFLYGSTENAIKELGPDFGVTLAHEDLQDIAKNNVPIMVQRNGVSLDEVRSYLRQQLCLSDSLVKKLTGPAWTVDPICAAMYGPAYYIGRTTVAKAIEKCGIEKVLRVGLGFKGFVDIETFRRKTGLQN